MEELNHNPLVSIVITSYKGTDTIERAVISAVEQSYPMIEIIVVDDNGIGTEEQLATEAIVRSIREKYPQKRICYIPHKQNKNGSAARNTGMRAARGKYIELLDDDDAFRAQKTEKQVGVLEEKGIEYGLCYTGMQIHSPTGGTKEQVQTDEGELFELVMQRRLHAPTSTFMVNRECMLAIGGFDEAFQRHQDWEFLDRMAYNYKIAVVPEVCMDRYIYKRNSAQNPDRYAQNRLFYLDKMSTYFDKLQPELVSKIKTFHYQNICKEYIRAKQLKEAFRYIKMCEHPVNAMVGLVVDNMRAKRA